MAQQNLNLGTAPNDGTGDGLRVSFQKIQANTIELYAALTPAAQPPNLVYAGPASGSAAIPSYRPLVLLDIPIVNNAIGIDSFNNIQLVGSISAANVSIFGTAGLGYLSKVNQSAQPAALNGSVKYYNDATGKFSYIRRNSGNTADIKMSFSVPDVNTNVIFATPTTAGSDTVAYLGTAQTYLATNTYNAPQNIKSINVLDMDGTTWRTAISVGSISNSFTIGATSDKIFINNIFPLNNGLTGIGEYSNPFGFISSKGMTYNLILELYGGSGIKLGGNGPIIFYSENSGSGPSGVISLKTGDFIATPTPGPGNTGSMLFQTGSNINTNTSDSGFTGWFIFDVGTVAANQKRGNFQIFGGTTPVNPLGMQRGLFIGNATAIPTANPTAGFFHYGNNGVPEWRTSGGAIISLGLVSVMADINIKHLIGGTATPTITAGVGAGTGATVTLVRATDLSGIITVVVGTAPTLSSAIVTVTFAVGYTTAPKIILVGANGTSAVLSGATMAFVDDGNTTNTSFVLTSGTVALPAGTYKWAYIVTQ